MGIMNLKRFLACLAIAAVLTVGVLCGLSLLPHTHGDDLDHSQNPHCPVHLVAGGHVDAVAVSPISLVITLVFFCLVLHQPHFHPEPVLTRSSSRAPPPF